MDQRELRNIIREIVREVVRDELQAQLAAANRVEAESPAAHFDADETALVLLNERETEPALAATSKPHRANGHSRRSSSREKNSQKAKPASASQEKNGPLIRQTPSAEFPVLRIQEPIEHQEPKATVRHAISDSDLKSQILESLASSGLPVMSRVTVDVKDGVLTLGGDVDSSEEKALASIFATRVPHILSVADQIRLVPRIKGDAGKSAHPGGFNARSISYTIRELPIYLKVLAGLFLFASLMGTVWALQPSGPPKPLKTSPLAGKVLLEGYPARGVTVVLHPTDPKAPINCRPNGSAAADGTFKFTTYKPYDGAPPGEYTVVVFSFNDPDDPLPPERAPIPIPQVYSKPTTSPIKVVVAEGDSELPPIQLKYPQKAGATR